MADFLYGYRRNRPATNTGMKKNARIKTGTRSKTGSASFRMGIFLIRVLTYRCRMECDMKIVPYNLQFADDDGLGLAH